MGKLEVNTSASPTKRRRSPSPKFSDMSSEDSLDNIIMAMEDKVAQQTDKVIAEVDLLREMRTNLQKLKVKKQRKTGARKLEVLATVHGGSIAGNQGAS